jgi:hypothetical protein
MELEALKPYLVRGSRYVIDAEGSLFDRNAYEDNNNT